MPGQCSGHPEAYLGFTHLDAVLYAWSLLVCLILRGIPLRVNWVQVRVENQTCFGQE